MPIFIIMKMHKNDLKNIYSPCHIYNLIFHAAFGENDSSVTNPVFTDIGIIGFTLSLLKNKLQNTKLLWN